MVTLLTESPVEVTSGSDRGRGGDGNSDLPARDRRSDRRVLVLSRLVLAVPLVVVLVGAWSYRWVQEDAFIDFRVVANLLAGHGPVYNVGERVEAYSDPLWVFLLTVTHEVVPFLSLEWLSVWLGLGGTAFGVVLGGRAMQRLGSRECPGVIVPIGLLIFSAVAGVWEFATSGLEMGLVFGWIGLSFWLLVRTETHRRSAILCAFVLGLGPLIRPELVLMSGVFLACLAVVVGARGWRGPHRLWGRWILPLIAALALPVAYELWRMAYFGMVVSNSELAKSGGGSDLPQGLVYVRSFFTTYALWIPLLLALPVTIPMVRRWWAAGDRTGTVVLATPLVAGVLDLLYVLRLGGDYMEARLLLPGFLCCCLAVFVDVGRFRTLLAVPLIGIVIWSVVCASSLRYDHVTAWVNNMHDERANMIADVGQAHPIDPTGYSRWVEVGPVLGSTAESIAPDRQLMLVLEDPAGTFIRPSKTSRVALNAQIRQFFSRNTGAASSDVPFRLAVDLASIGGLGYLAGPKVYIFDTLSIANPIGSHTTVAVRGIPGHEKAIGVEWMIARFGVVGDQFPRVHIFGLASETAAARRALACGPLKSYLSAVTKPLTFSQALSNMAHAFAYTTMSFSPDANNAARQLCGG